MRPLCNDGEPHSVFTAFLGNALHGTARAFVLRTTFTRDVGVCLFAHQQQREFLELWIPVIEFKGESTDLRSHHGAYIEGNRTQVNDGDLRPGITETDKIA